MLLSLDLIEADIVLANPSVSTLFVYFCLTSLDCKLLDHSISPAR